MLGPIKHKRGEALYNGNFQAVEPNMSWEDAIPGGCRCAQESCRRCLPDGNGSDHLFDLVSDLADATGAPAPIRFSAASMFEAQATLSQAAEDLFGQAGLPFFDIGNSDLVLSFGANFLETWLSPVAYNLAFAKMRQGNPQRRGYFVQFESRMSQTAAKADEWIPIQPGTEGMVALAIGRLVAEAQGRRRSPRRLPAWILRKSSAASGVIRGDILSMSPSWSVRPPRRSPFPAAWPWA